MIPLGALRYTLQALVRFAEAAVRVYGALTGALPEVDHHAPQALVSALQHQLQKLHWQEVRALFG